ncbi:MAG: SxtJ family membrane protein [Rhodospirillales bacterium]
MAAKASVHEDYGRKDEVKAGSERSLGLVFAAVFAIIGLFPLWDGGPLRIWGLVVGAVFVFLGLAAPGTLKPLNQIWFRFGLLLHKVVSPLVMGLLFFTTITPFAVVMKIMGKDSLKLKFDRKAESYWIERHPPGPDPKSMTNQF